MMGGCGGGGCNCVFCGNDLCYNLNVMLEEVFSGLQKIINVFVVIVCDVCDGLGGEFGSEFVICLICLGMGKVCVQ